MSPSRVTSQKESMCIKPRFCDSVIKVLNCPITLISMMRKDQVIEFKPLLFMNIRIKGFDRVIVNYLWQGIGVEVSMKFKYVTHD